MAYFNVARTYWPRLIETLLGLVFLVGALLKALDINTFAVQISYYGVLSNPTYLSLAALITLGIETFLGTCLLFNIHIRRLIHLLVLVLLVVFTFLILYGWFYHGLKECGCFGPIEMSPEVSIAKNIVLGLFCLAACWGKNKLPLSPFSRTFLLLKIFITTLLVISMLGYAYTTLEPIVKTERQFAQFVFDVDGTHWDLGTGEYFVAMLSMTCEHCKASVSSLNELGAIPDFPRVVALCYEDKEGALVSFKEETSPEFELFSITDRIRTFFSLVGVAPPRFYYVRDGIPIHFWDETLPTSTELFQVRTNTKNTHFVTPAK